MAEKQKAVAKADPEEGIESKVGEPVEKAEAAPTKGHLMDVGPGALGVDLPCGYLDPDGVLHDTAVVTEMTGYEEDILGGKGGVVARLTKIITNCTKQVGMIESRDGIAAAVGQLTASDRMAMLLAIRRVSLGDFYEVRVKCPNEDCKDDVRFTLNLANIDVIKMPDPYTRSREDEVVIPGPNGTEKKIVVKWHAMTTADETWLNARMKKKEDILTLGMLARVDAIDGVEIDRTKRFPQALKALKSLSLPMRTAIRRLFDDAEGSVDTNVEFICPSCEHEWEADMDMGQTSFFFPSET